MVDGSACVMGPFAAQAHLLFSYLLHAPRTDEHTTLTNRTAACHTYPVAFLWTCCDADTCYGVRGFITDTSVQHARSLPCRRVADVARHCHHQG